LPVSPAFANAAANGIAEFNNPAVPAGEITSVTVYFEACRKRKLEQAVQEGLTAGGALLVSPAEAGDADIRHATAIALSGGQAAGNAPMQAQLDSIQAHLENIPISRQNRKARFICVFIMMELNIFYFEV
jgi:hypothetical protein